MAFKPCTCFVPNYHRLCRWMWPLSSSLTALNIMFPVCPAKGPRWGQAIFGNHIAVLPCFNVIDSPVWGYRKGFVLPLDDLSITAGPTAVVFHCVRDECVCLNVCAQTSVAAAHLAWVRTAAGEVSGTEGELVCIVLISISWLYMAKCCCYKTVTRYSPQADTSPYLVFLYPAKFVLSKQWGMHTIS